MFEIAVRMHRFFCSQNIALHLLKSIKLLCDQNSITTQMTANLVLNMTTTGDKSESESGISLEKVENGKFYD